MNRPAGGTPGAGPGDRETGQARERTSLAWTRTALAFGAVGGAMLRENVVTGLVILVMGSVVWQLGRVSRGGAAGRPATLGARRLFLITVAVVAVSLICLVVAVLGKSVPGALR